MDTIKKTIKGFDTKIISCSGVCDSYYNAYVEIPPTHCLYGYHYSDLGDNGHNFISHPLSYSDIVRSNSYWVYGITGDYLHQMIGLESKPLQTMEAITEKLHEILNKLNEVQRLYEKGEYTPPKRSETTQKILKYAVSRGHKLEHLLEH